MNRTVSIHSTVLGVLLAISVAPKAASASTAEEFLNAPIWYVQYEVTFNSSSQGSGESLHGLVSFTATVERVFSASDKLNLRSQGPGAISLMAMYGGADGKKMSAAEQQAASMRMLDAMDHQANWSAVGNSLDENPDLSASVTPSSPARVDYTRVNIGNDLVEETGGHYSMKATMTAKGSATVLVASMGTLLLEMDTAANTFVLTLPMGFDDRGAKLKMDTVTFTQPKGTTGTETRETSEYAIGSFVDGLTLDDPTLGFQEGGVTIRGTIDPSKGQIAGVQMFPAHYNEGVTSVAGTLTFKYTLTMTPPAKK